MAFALFVAAHTSMLLDKALLASRACSLAFLPPSAIPSSPYAKDLRCIAQVEDPESLAGATILKHGDSCIIACRGSASVRNFRTNFNVGPVALESADGAAARSGAKVHNGFQRASKELWRQIEPRLPRTAKSLVITGHSLGGGTATLIALRAQAAGLAPELVTVAGPRLGNAAFAAHFREQCSEAVHLYHDDDDVLKSNRELWDNLGFEHVGRELLDGRGVGEVDDEGRRLAPGVDHLRHQLVARVDVAQRQPAALVRQHARRRVPLPRGCPGDQSDPAGHVAAELAEPALYAGGGLGLQVRRDVCEPARSVHLLAREGRL